MTTATITREIDAVQWGGDVENIPESFVLSVPEITRSAARDLFYITYGKLIPRDWMTVAKLEAEPEKNALKGRVGYTPKDGERYWRETLPFMCWSVKSEGSAALRRGETDHGFWHVPLDLDDPDQVQMFHDFASYQQWPNPVPRFVEFREVNGSFGGGYRPHVLAAGDWLLREPGADPRVVTDEEFQEMRQ